MANNNFYGRDPFGNMDDIFNELMGNMGGYNSENRRGWPTVEVDEAIARDAVKPIEKMLSLS